MKAAAPSPPPPRRNRRGRRGLLAALLLLAASGSACWIERVGPEAEDDESGLREEVREMLDRSAAAWNRGDLEAFLDDYERSPNTTYIGSSGRIEGWDGIRARYAPALAPGAERDSLRFVDLHVRSLGQRHALATARYVLHREGETTSTGPFTLVLVSVESRWRIIHDHTSEDPPEAGTDDETRAAGAGTGGEGGEG